jgi:hypothetical protein
VTDMRGINIILFAALSGCTWVSKATLDDRAPEFDNDGDGVKAAKDCDDHNPDRFPGNTEVWYDGVDGDCELDDDYDADKDGHVSTAHQGIKTIDVKGTGISPGGDCDDTNDKVNPSTSDDWYDGIDSDCGGNDDFDQDYDGYASEAEPYEETQYVSGSGALLAEDCDDFRDDVHPGADDQELDGEDSDCAGNDDFDIDNDGHYSDEALFYQATIYAETTTGLAVPGDCDDHDATMYAYVDAEHPGAPDEPYDGIDKDCAGDDDFDQDRDGFVRDVDEGRETTPVTGSGTLPAGDCNDDPALDGATAHPNAVEILSDAIDHDCDGLSDAVGKDTFRLAPISEIFEDEGTEYIGVHTLRFGENAEGIHLTVGAAGNGVNTAGVIYNFAFSPTDPIGGVIDSYMMNEGSSSESGSPYTLSDAMATWTDDDVHLSATGATFHSSEIRTLYVRGMDLARDDTLSVGAGPSRLDVGLFEWNPLTGVSMHRDSAGDFHVIGCDPITEVVQYAIGTPTSLALGSGSPTPSFSENHHLVDFSASTCALFERSEGELLMLNDQAEAFRAHTIGFDPDTEEFLLLDEVTAGLPAFDDDLEEAQFDGLFVPTARAPQAVFLVVDDFSNNVLIVDADFQVIQEVDVILDIVSLDAAFAPDGTLHMVIVDSGGEGWLYEADLDGGIVAPASGLKLSLGDLTRAALWIDGTGKILQVAATTTSMTSADPIVYGRAYLTPPTE